MKVSSKRREKASTIESLLLQGVKTLELSMPEERTCTECGETFPVTWAPQKICQVCVEDHRRLTAEELRASRAEERRRRLGAIGLTGELCEMTFGRYVRALDAAAFDAARHFAEHWADGNLVLIGVVGSGKTHLCAAIAQDLSDQGVNVRYAHVPTIAYELRSAGSGEGWGEVARKRVNPLWSADVAILDDLGREKKTDAWAEAMDALIDHRVNDHAPIVIATNLSTGNLRDHIGAAALSRLLKTTAPIKTVDEDRRMNPVRVRPVAESERDPLEECGACKGAGWVRDSRLKAGHNDALMKCPACAGRGW